MEKQDLNAGNQPIQPFDLTPNYTTQHEHNGIDCPKISAKNIKGYSSITSTDITSALGYTPENVVNKVTSVTGVSDTNYPSEKAVASYLGFNAGGTLFSSADNNQTTSSASYVKVKEIQMNRGGAGIRVKFELQQLYTSYRHYGQVYKNGVAIGTERIDNSNTGAYTTWSQDFGSFVSGDLFQLYIKSDGGASCSIQNFRLYKLDDSTINLN